MDYKYKREVKSAFAEAVAATKAGLTKEGFGVLAEIDVKAALKQKDRKSVV